ncbi:peptidase M61 [Aquimarina sp. 2201CG5-10]|uniref:M61 family metallopeptidase n=1 Tax=Aquimarina callyspongiae TaxID=3098150 RepID=UPI002AB3B506|nr:peptidase M61 [Aquimarina sp. 2201CG5-10]MDY8137890.1 peptidase M61 [Aquimarina sp. 2201CG5-10]
MIETYNSLKNTVLASFIFCLVVGCKSSQPVVSVDYTPIITNIDLVNIIKDKVKVELQVANFNVDTISYYLPKIVPGTYQNNNYGKYIEDFQAYDRQGNLLPIEKHGDNRWKINNAQQLHKISYWVNDTFDSENTHDIFSPTGSNISKNKNFILNLYAFVGYFDGMKEKKYRLFIKRPKSLESSTSLVKISSESTSENIQYETDFFLLKRYAEVADSPIMYTQLDKVTFTVNDIDVLLSVYSPNKIHKASQIMPVIERVIRAQKNFLGNINSTKKYSILLYLSTSKSNDARGFGALEHNTSTVVVLPESLSHQKLSESLTDVVSHEFFHIVTPLTIHSKEIHDFDYNNPKMSQHLWLYEGTTEYFSLLFQITQGLISKEEFFERILEKIETAKAFDDTLSFTEMSTNILDESYHKNYRNVYEKGALISMCLDIILREKSNGTEGILDLIKNLSSLYGSNVPFEDEELIKVIKEMSPPEVGAFFDSHVIGNTPIDYAEYLKKFGLKFGTIDVPSSYFIYEQEPYIKSSEATKKVLFTEGAIHNSFLKNIGIEGGDALLSINNKKYNLKNIYDLFGDSNKWKIGDVIKVKIERNNQILTFTSNVIKPTVKKIIIEENPNAAKYQINLLKRWIND